LNPAFSCYWFAALSDNIPAISLPFLDPNIRTKIYLPPRRRPFHISEQMDFPVDACERLEIFVPTWEI